MDYPWTGQENYYTSPKCDELSEYTDSAHIQVEDISLSQVKYAYNVYYVMSYTVAGFFVFMFSMILGQ